MKEPVGIVGAGLVGSGWAIVFSRAGHPVRIHDANPEQRAAIRDRIAENLIDLKTFDLIDEVDPILERIEIVDRLDDAVTGVAYVQESVLEKTEVKREVYAAIDRSIGPDIAVGSSSSGIPASAFTEDCRHRGNYLVAHPVNPPYLVPVVELVPAPWTAPGVVDRVDALMSAVGQVPVRVHGEVEGFILNRLQGALLREAWALFEEGYASAADIDRTVSHGLGLRWSFMGPFETIDLNAPGGVRDYAERLGDLYLSIARSRTEPKAWDDELISRVEQERRDALPLTDLPSRCGWRDRRLMALAAHKQRNGNDHD